MAALESQKKKIFESESSVPVEQESLSLNALRKPKEKRDAKSASTETRSELKNILNQVLASSENNKKDDLKSEVKKEEKTKDPKEIPEDELRALLEVAES